MTTQDQPHPSPPTHSNFETKIRFDTQATLVWSDVYGNALGAFNLLAVRGYDCIIPVALHIPGVREELVLDAISTPRAPSALQSKHAVQAIYEAGMQLAAKSITRNGFVPRMFATLELNGRPIGFMKWKHRTIRGATNTSEIIGDDADDINGSGELTTSSLQISRRADETGLIPFPDVPGLKIRYEIFEHVIPMSEMFSMFLEALADAATHAVFERDAYVNAVSVSGTAALNMHGLIVDHRSIPVLAWGQLMQTLSLLWRHVALEHSKSFDFFLERDGKRLAAGFVQLT